MRASSIILAALAAALALPAQADDEKVSKNAGICMAYKVAAKEERDAEQAMRTAPNKPLATNYGLEWTRRARAFGTNANGEIDKVFAFEAESACRKIGIRSSL